MGTVYIAIILVCRVAQSLCNKQTSEKISNISRFFKYSAFSQLLSAFLALMLILIAQNGFSCNVTTLAISSFSGTMLVLGSWFNILALKNGTIALASMFGTAGILIPCIAGIFLFDTPMSPGQWSGVGLFFLAAYFLISSSSRIYSRFSVKAFFLLLGVMFTNGFTMLAQQMFTFYVPNGDVSVFSFLSFGIVGVFMLIMSLAHTETRKADQEETKLTAKLLCLGTVLSIAVFVINQLATLATALVPPAVLFTFINGGGTIISAIVAALCFHERLTAKSITGIILGVLSMVLVKAM